MTESDIPTGLATCMKSGNALQVVIPKAIIDRLNLQPRDRVIISVQKSGLDPKEPRRTDLKKNLNIFQKKESRAVVSDFVPATQVKSIQRIPKVTDPDYPELDENEQHFVDLAKNTPNKMNRDELYVGAIQDFGDARADYLIKNHVEKKDGQATQ